MAFNENESYFVKKSAHSPLLIILFLGCKQDDDPIVIIDDEEETADFKEVIDLEGLIVSVELWEDEAGEDSFDESLLGFREDHDWIFHGLCQEPLHLRDNGSHDIWLERG